jgi:hypothetical protein
MIAMIEYDLYNYKLNIPTVKYEFINCQNIDDIKLAYAHKEKISYIGPILKKSQIENLTYYGNTVLPKPLLNKINNEDILKEVKRLTGLTCSITITRGDTVLLINNN